MSIRLYQVDRRPGGKAVETNGVVGFFAKFVNKLIYRDTIDKSSGLHRLYPSRGFASGGLNVRQT